MKKIIKKTGFTVLFLFLSGMLLLYPALALDYAGQGLQIWFQKMIPTLFPFMVLTGMMIRLHLADSFSRRFRPLLTPLTRLDGNCQFCIVTGFLCGFPMGAKVCGELYQAELIDKEEADLLLAFCNNIGPVYFTGLVLPLLPRTVPPLFYYFGMYGLPLCYGLFLRYFRYGRKIGQDSRSRRAPQKPPTFALALDQSISSGIRSITKLGGYMIFFNVLNLLPFLLCRKFPAYLRPSLPIPAALLLEISGGILLAGKNHPLLILSLLHFGGFSCIAQTYSMISQTNLSIKPYILHKILQTLLAFGFYSMVLLCVHKSY